MSGFRSSVSWVMMHIGISGCHVPQWFASSVHVVHQCCIASCICRLPSTVHATVLSVLCRTLQVLHSWCLGGYPSIHDAIHLAMGHDSCHAISMLRYEVGCYYGALLLSLIYVDVVQHPAIHRQIALWPSPVLRYLHHLTTRHYLHTMGSTPYSCRRKR